MIAKLTRVAFLGVLVLAGACGGTDSPADGIEGGECYPNGTCNEGLVCSASNICVKPFPTDSRESQADVVPLDGSAEQDVVDGQLARADVSQDVPAEDLHHWDVLSDLGPDEVWPQDAAQPEVSADGALVNDNGPVDTGFPPDEGWSLDIPPKDIPPLEKPAKAWVTINGGGFVDEQVKFTSTKMALYLAPEQELYVTMGKGTYLLELHLADIEEGLVGAAQRLIVGGSPALVPQPHDPDFGANHVVIDLREADVGAKADA